MYSSAVPVQAPLHCVPMYLNLTESLQENVLSIQKSLLELQELLTDLPHDMLDDDLSSPELNFSDCSEDATVGQTHQVQEPESSWNEHQVLPKPQSGYNDIQNLYPGEKRANGWEDHHRKNEDIYAGCHVEEGHDGGRSGYSSSSDYEQNDLYQLPENFRPYTNGQKQEFNNQPTKIINFPDGQREHFQQFGTTHQALDSYKVTYKPYPISSQNHVSSAQERAGRKDGFEEMQQRLLESGENSLENMQIVQLQVLNKAKERRLTDLCEKLEESERQIRYLNHQLVMLKDEKDGLALSLQESQNLLQKGKEKEIQFEGQIKALETQIQTLKANEEQMIKKTRVSEVAMENLRQQLLELHQSDSLQRTKEQHENIVLCLRKKYEDQVTTLQKNLDATNAVLQEQKDICCRLRDHVKQIERSQEENKIEKTEIINRLTKNLEESQKQCAALLETGSIQEINQLRIQLQQAQSAHALSDNMNKALQEELAELKEEISLYESAAKLGVFPNDLDEELDVDLAESYVDLGIKKVIWKKSEIHSTMPKPDPKEEPSKDEIISRLKSELQRLLTSNTVKRRLVSQLQNDLKDCHRKVEDLSQLKKSQEKCELETKAINVEKSPNRLWHDSSVCDKVVKEDILRLKNEIQTLQQENKELKATEEKLKNTNQDLCSQMRQMVQDSDRDKQETVERCERTFQQHHEAMKNQIRESLLAKHALEKQQLLEVYESNRLQLSTDLDKVNKEMAAVQECYLAVCKEKDNLETTIRKSVEKEQQAKEEMLKKQLLEEKEADLSKLKVQLEEKLKCTITATKSQGLKEKETDVKQQIENEEILAKTRWENEQKEIKDKVIQQLEREWRFKLDQTIKEMKKKTFDCGIQTDQIITPDVISKKEMEAMIEEQQWKIQQDALQEKEAAIKEALRKQEEEMAAQHHHSVKEQVEVAVLNARSRWLQELPDLAEYRAHLKTEQMKWEAEHELSVAKKKNEIVMISATKETGDQASFPAYSVGHQMQLQKILKQQNFSHEKAAETVFQGRRRIFEPQEDSCCEQCLHKLEKAKQECQDLKKMLEKSCRHLQHAVREHKATVEKIGEENNRVVEELMEENNEMKMKLEELRALSIPQRSFSEGAVDHSCLICNGKGLEELRGHYIKAVKKIKGDMIRYIQGSKQRAAELLKAELFKERQETARRMRKYYLVCLHQLLQDDGRQEGAEKKIMNAASKLATMAKVLETPIRNRTQTNNSPPAVPQSSELLPGIERSKRNYMNQNRGSHMENKSSGRDIPTAGGEQVLQKRLPCNLRRRLEDTEHMQTKHVAFREASSGVPSSVAACTQTQQGDLPRNAHPESVCSEGEKNKAGAHVQSENTHRSPQTPGLSDSGSSHVTFQGLKKKRILKEHRYSTQTECCQQIIAGKSPNFDIQETPVKDEEGPSDSLDWSSKSVSPEALPSSNDASFLFPLQPGILDKQIESVSFMQFPTHTCLSDTEEKTNKLCRQFLCQNDHVPVVKKEDKPTQTEQVNKPPGRASHPSSDVLKSDFRKLNSAAHSVAYHRHSRKLFMAPQTSQQDSGFDSPMANLD
ncbi:centrosomal protein of 152 kDa isoform X11 [Notamacropus eugenii]|uniref:centrosomal protein of 152 kDa isoform X11 n=1 Tax=Notamacropus eugenii TaxID=9315 RepID=UPI003B67CF7A